MWRSQLSSVALPSVSCSKIEAELTSTPSGPNAEAASGTSARAAWVSRRSACSVTAARPMARMRLATSSAPSREAA